jgi:hypothetical protein
MDPDADPDEAERRRLKAIVIDTKEELVASFSEFEPLDSASLAGINAGAMVFKVFSVKTHPDKRNRVSTYFNALKKFRDAWLTGTRHNVQMTTWVADFLEPPFDTRVTPHVRIEEGDFVASSDDLRDPDALMSDFKSANLWLRLITNAGGLDRIPLFEPHRFEDFELDIQNLELASIVYISMADQNTLVSGTAAAKRKLRQKIKTASHVLMTGEGESVTIVHRVSGNTRVMADKELYPRCRRDSVRRRTEFLNRVHSLSLARTRSIKFHAVFSHRGGQIDRVSGTIAAANILATIGAQAWNKPIPAMGSRAEEPGYERNDEDSRAWGTNWQDLLGIPAQQYLNARQLLVINSGVESPFALGTKANSAAIIAATEWDSVPYSWTVKEYTLDAQVVDLGDDDDAPNDGAGAQDRAQPPASDAPAAAEARSPASDAPAGDAQPTEDRAQPPSDATAASEDARQTEGSNDLERQSQFSSPRSGQPSPQGYRSSFSDGSPGQGLREHLDWENEQYQSTEYRRQQQLTAEERDAESPAPQATEVEVKKPPDGDSIGIAQTSQDAQPAAEAQPAVKEQPALDPEQGVEHPDADQALELCNAENIFLDQGIVSFCDCFTLGTKWLSLHNIEGCCKGGTSSKSRRQAKGPSCGSLKCGRCMWEKESDTGVQCDAIAVGSNETRRTGCFHCKQSVGPIAIFDDPSHTCEHFPKYDLNGTRHGWCFNRVARHKDFVKKKPDWTTIKIYASLTAEAGRRRDNEAQAQERSKNDPDLPDTETVYVIDPLQKIAETQASKTGNSDDDDLDDDLDDDVADTASGPVNIVDLTDDATPTVDGLRRSARHQTTTIPDESFGNKNWTKLNTEGWVVLEGAALRCLRMDTLDHLKTVMKVVHTLSNGPDPRDDDGGRWQEDFPEDCKDADLVETIDKLTALCGSLFPGLFLSSPLILGSRAHCRTQRPAHTDADTEKFSMDDTVVPLSIMIALQKDTRVILYPGSHKWIRNGGTQQSKGKLITLKRGSIIVWRGDLVHQGAPYKIPNMRLFFEAYPPGHTVELNEIDDGTSRVVYRNHPVRVVEPDSPKAAGDTEEEASKLSKPDETGEATKGD